MASPRGFLMSQPSHPLPTSAFVSRGCPPGCPRGCHCLSPADIMADKEGVTLSLEEEEEDADVALAYKTPEKKSLQEIQELDPGDESLRKYKQALLGAIPAAVGKAGGCSRVWARRHPGSPAGGCSLSGRRELGRAGAGSVPRGIPGREGTSRLESLVGAACAPHLRRDPGIPRRQSTGARGPQLPWLRDHRRSFHRNGYREPGNSWG